MEPSPHPGELAEVAAALDELPELLGDVRRRAPSSAHRAGPVRQRRRAIAAELVTPCGSRASSWRATSCRRVEVAAAAASHVTAPDRRERFAFIVTRTAAME
jgi:hypothetical protein